MSPLLEALATWPDRRTVQDSLAGEGFQLHVAYQKMVTLACKEGDGPVGLARYWDEVAREYFCSAGKVDSDHRLFFGETTYRSDFLDSLANATDIASTGPRLSLDPCLHAFSRQLRQPTDFATGVREGLERLKESEYARFHIDATEWTNQKSDIPMWLGRYAKELGCERRGKYWQKILNASLIVRHSVDMGRRNTWQIMLPLVTEIIHVKDHREAFDASVTSKLIPGFSYYALYDGAESGKLGILAHIKLFDVIGRLLPLRL